MWQAGFVGEVRTLAEAGLRDCRTASRALGYAQVLRFLAGEWTEEDAAAETVRVTRRFVRRQESWFRRDPRVRWLAAGGPAADGPGTGDGPAAADGPATADRALAAIREAGLPGWLP
jgi:tRNA A37 N6-isopentenylltransferase MiaA